MESPPAEDYEAERQRRIEANLSMLRSLGLADVKPVAEKKKPTAAKKDKHKAKESHLASGGGNKENKADGINSGMLPRSSTRLQAKPRISYCESPASSRSGNPLQSINDVQKGNKGDRSKDRPDEKPSAGGVGGHLSIIGVDKYSWITLRHLIAKGLLRAGDLAFFKGFAGEISEDGTILAVSSGLQFISPTSFVLGCDGHFRGVKRGLEQDGSAWDMVVLESGVSLQSLRKRYFESASVQGDLPASDFLPDDLLRTAFGSMTESSADSSELKGAQNSTIQKRKGEFEIFEGLKISDANMSSSNKKARSSNANFIFLLTNVPMILRSDVEKATKMFGGRIEERLSAAVTHLVTVTDEKGFALRTTKYVFGLARGLPILRFEWIHDSIAKGDWADVTEYVVLGDTSAGRRLKPNERKSGLFANYHFSLAGPFTLVPERELKYIILAAGGRLKGVTIQSGNHRQIDGDASSELDFESSIYVREVCAESPSIVGQHTVSWIFDWLSRGFPAVRDPLS